jgi:2-dehydro-3-deoxyphosphogluconate aldolase / (4S)-4-hydroxy-2-oxoglutarate aldolase
VPGDRGLRGSAGGHRQRLTGAYDRLLPDVAVDAANLIVERRLLAVIRASSAAAAVETARSALAGGVTVLEVAYTTPDATEAIRQLTDAPLLGAGTVLTAGQAAEAVAAGARFLVSPGVVPEVIAFARRHGVAVLPGAATVTEILTALEAGADLVKLFPAEVLGLKFLKAVRQVLPQARLVPTGGITADNAGEWLAAGAAAVGVGGWLTDGSPEQVRERAGRLVDVVSRA